MIKKLALITTHPIQYYAPVFKLLAQKTDLMVFYTLGESSVSKYDPGFNKTIKWDINLLDGYNYQWVKNTAADPGSHKFYGILNPDLIDQLKTWRPDAILVYGWAYKSHLSVMRYFKNKVPVFFRGDSTLLDKTGWLKTGIRNIFLKWVYSYVDHVFYTGINNKAYFKKFGVKEAQLTFAPHAVDNKRFAEDRVNEVNALKKELNINNEDLVLLFAGKFEYKKDPLLLLEAFLQLPQLNIHLLFVGNGHLEEKLKIKAAANSNIHFIDFANQSYMPVIYQTCDLFCLPSKGPGESWGLAVNEAMACSKAVLVADKAGCAVDLVFESKNGYIFQSGHLNELVMHLKALITSKELLVKFGQNSAAIIKDWNFDALVHAIEKKLINEA